MPRAKITDLRQTVKNKYASLGKLEGRGGVSWRDADSDLLRAAAASVTEDGAALLLSQTSDGGALCVQVWSGEGRHKLYPATHAELAEALQLIIEIANS